MNASIIHNDRIAPGYYRMGIRLSGPGRAFSALPGQFVMLRVAEGFDPLLRRPFGVYDVIGSRTPAAPAAPFKGAGVEIMYRVVGKGTLILSEKKPGEPVDLLGPVGNGFSVPEDTAGVVLVGGGMGIAPLYLPARRLKGATVLFGGRNRSDAKLVRDFRKIPGLRLRVATEDGSVGAKGFVTTLIKDSVRPGSVVYACGPVGMLRETARIAGELGLKCLVSLERSMACGIGVCLGCAVRARTHEEAENKKYRMVCSEGPVFDSTDIDWSTFD